MVLRILIFELVKITGNADKLGYIIREESYNLRIMPYICRADRLIAACPEYLRAGRGKSGHHRET